MRKERLLTLDIGNRGINIYITVGDELCGKWSFLRIDPSWSSKLRSIFQRSGASDAVLVSVVPESTEMAVTILQEMQIQPIIISGEIETPIKIDYGTLKYLVADRVAVAVGAWIFYSDQAKQIVAVDAGTAITIDLIRDAIFLGGAIMPGIGLMLKSLQAETSQLNFEIKDVIPQFPAKSSEKCISAGIVAAAAGAVEFLWKKYTYPENSSLLILTGGDAEMLAQYLSVEFIIDPLLLLKGAVAIRDFVLNRRGK